MQPANLVLHPTVAPRLPSVRCSATYPDIFTLVHWALLTNWLSRVVSALRSFRVSGAASGLYGRSIKLRRRGRKQEALATARRGLALLRARSIHRSDGVDSGAAHSVQAMLTVQVEQLAHELGAEGAERSDLANVVGFLRVLPPETEGPAASLKNEWLPYLERRLGRSSREAGNNSRGLERGAAEQGDEADER